MKKHDRKTTAKDAKNAKVGGPEWSSASTLFLFATFASFAVDLFFKSH